MTRLPKALLEKQAYNCGVAIAGWNSKRSIQVATVPKNKTTNHQAKNLVNWLLKFSQTLHMRFRKQHPGKRIGEGVWYHKSSEKCKYNPEFYCFYKVQKVLFSILKYVFNLNRITLPSLLLSSSHPQISFLLPIPWFSHLTLLASFWPLLHTHLCKCTGVLIQPTECIFEYVLVPMSIKHISLLAEKFLIINKMISIIIKLNYIQHTSSNFMAEILTFICFRS